jgi:hypothetical protein
MSWIDRLIETEDRMVAEAEARERTRVLQQVWDALDKAYADSDPQGPTRKGIGIAASIVAQMKRASSTAALGVPVTGRIPDMLQDQEPKLSRALASKPDAPLHAREAAQAIRAEYAALMDRRRALILSGVPEAELSLPEAPPGVEAPSAAQLAAAREVVSRAFLAGPDDPLVGVEGPRITDGVGLDGGPKHG